MPTYICPICQTKLSVSRPEEAPYRPFCSVRCKLVDLGRWLNEEYRVTEEVPEALEPREVGDEEEDDTKEGGEAQDPAGS